MKTRVLAFAVVLCVPFAFTADDPSVTTQLWEHRNLGKAFYENPDTHQQAAEELRKALQLAPNSVREQINYGLGLLRAGQTDAGVAELIRAQKQDPKLPHTWFNLGIAYKHAGDYDKAIEQFQGMIKLAPNEPTAHYNLATALRSKNDNGAALPEFLKAEQLNGDLAGPHFQLFTLYQRAGDKQDATRERQLFEEAKKKNAGAAVPEDMEWCFYAELYDPPEPRPSAETEPTHYKEQVVSSGWNASHSQMQVIDAEGSGRADLLVWSPERVELWKRGVDLAKNSGLENLKDVRDVAPGDFDNDGLTDLCVVTGAGAAIFHNNHGVFKKQFDLPNTAGMNKALPIDYDHDNDLDLLLFGLQTVLLRNDGNGKFEDKSESLPAVKGGKALDAVVIALRGDTAARDVVVSYADRGGVLYTDKLNGVFEASELPAISAGSAGLDAQDFDHDGLIDVVVYRPEIYAVRNHEGALELARGTKAAPSGIRADFNGDQREDYARLLPDGSLHLYTNDSANQHWLSVGITGVKNLKSATNATVEVKSGALL